MGTGFVLAITGIAILYFWACIGLALAITETSSPKARATSAWLALIPIIILCALSLQAAHVIRFVGVSVTVIMISLALLGVVILTTWPVDDK